MGEDRIVIGWIERNLTRPGEDESTGRRRVRLIFATILVIPAGLHGGKIRFESRPGITRFTVELSIEPAAALASRTL